MVIEDSSMGLVGLVSPSIVRLLSQRRQSVAPEQRRFYVALVAAWKHERVPMAGAYVLYYPPTTGHPFLVVSFPADAAMEVKSFASEEEAETFVAEKTGVVRSPVE
jgi:hypothetical protein